MLTLTWGIDILFEKLTPETGMNLRNTLCTNMPLWVGISWKPCDLGASE